MALMLEIKVVPQSGRSQLVIDKSGILRCYIKAAPEKGKANKEVIEVLSKTLRVPKGAIEIVSGLTGRKKLLKVQTKLTYEHVLQILGSGIQKKIL